MHYHSLDGIHKTSKNFLWTSYNRFKGVVTHHGGIIILQVNISELSIGVFLGI